MGDYIIIGMVFLGVVAALIGWAWLWKNKLGI